MGAITILLVLGICVFLLWFFQAVLDDASVRGGETVIDLRSERMRQACVPGPRQAASRRPAPCGHPDGSPCRIRKAG